MRKKIILGFALIILVFVLVIIFFKYYKKNDDNSNFIPNYVEKKDVKILDSTAPYIFKKVYKYSDGNLCITDCDLSKDSTLYAIIKTETPFPKILNVSSETIALLISDGDYLKLVDLKNRVIHSFNFDNSLNYQLVINNEKLLGFIGSSSTKGYFYNYNLDKFYYVNGYYSFDFIDGYLIAFNENSFNILNQETEEIFIRINNVSYKESKIKDINIIDNNIHIRFLDKNGYYSYYVIDKNNREVFRLLGNYEDIFLYENLIYALNNQGAYIYDFFGNFKKTTYFNGSINKVILNYAIISNKNTLNLVNMYNGESIILFQNINKLTITDVEYLEESNKILLILSEYEFVDIPKKYKIIYDISLKKIDVYNIN